MGFCGCYLFFSKFQNTTVVRWSTRKKKKKKKKKMGSLQLLVIVSSKALISSLVRESFTTFIPNTTISPILQKTTSGDERDSVDYYDIGYCNKGTLTNKNKIKSSTLHDMVFADYKQTSPFEFTVMEDLWCKKITTCSGYSFESFLNYLQLLKFDNLIRSDYRINMELAGIPLVSTHEFRTETRNSQCSSQLERGQNNILLFPELVSNSVKGVPVGGCESGMSFIYNHYDFFVYYNTHSHESGEVFITGFEVHPRSILSWKCSKGGVKVFSDVKNGPRKVQLTLKKVSWTYSVAWIRKPDSTWSSSVDYLFRSSRMNKSISEEIASVHWFRSITSLLIISTCCSIVFLLLKIHIRLELQKIDLCKDETLSPQNIKGPKGWFTVRHILLEPPKHPSLFIYFISIGSQLCFIIVSLVIFIPSGYFFPSCRPSVPLTVSLLFILSNSLCGYVAGSLTVVLQLSERFSQKIVGVSLVIPLFTIITLHAIGRCTWLVLFGVCVVSLVGISVALFGASVAVRNCRKQRKHSAPVRNTVRSPIPLSNIAMVLVWIVWFIVVG